MENKIDQKIYDDGRNIYHNTMSSDPVKEDICSIEDELKNLTTDDQNIQNDSSHDNDSEIILKLMIYLPNNICEIITIKKEDEVDQKVDNLCKLHKLPEALKCPIVKLIIKAISSLDKILYSNKSKKKTKIVNENFRNICIGGNAFFNHSFSYTENNELKKAVNFERSDSLSD